MTLEQQRALAVASARARMSDADFAAVKADGPNANAMPISPQAQASMSSQISPYLPTEKGTDVAAEIGQMPYNVGANVNDAAAKYLPAPFAAGLGAAANFVMNAIPLAVGGGAGPSFSSIGAKRIAMANELKSAKAPLVDTMNASREAGYVMPPSMTNPTLTNRILESFGGKAATAQEASLRNADVTANLVRKEIGAPPNMGITDDALAALRESKAQPYRDVAEIPAAPAARDFSNINPNRNPYPVFGPQPEAPAALLNEWRDANLRAKQFWNEYQKQGSVTAYDSYQALRTKAKNIETAMEDAANQAGRSDLIPKLRAARTDIAKIHDVERAMNASRGEVSAIDLGKALDRGVPLTGGLETAGRMGNAFPKAIQAPERIGSPAVNNLVAGLSGAGGAGIGAALGGGSGGMLGAAVGSIGVPIAQAGARSLLLSKPYQKLMGTPNYDASALSKLLAQTPVNANQAAYTMFLADSLRDQGK